MLCHLLKKELILWLVLGTSLLMAEGILRCYGSKWSENISVVDRISTQSRTISELPVEDRILIFGNSKTLNGISQEILANNFQEMSGRKFSGEIIAMHGAYSIEWEWILRCSFLNKQRMPGILVINVSPAGLHAQRPNLRRMGMEALCDNQYPYLPDEHALPTFGDRCEFVLSGLSVLYSRSINIGTKVKQYTIPHYELGERKIHAIFHQSSKKIQQQKAGKDLLHETRSIFEHCRSAGCKIIVVLMPVKSPQKLSESLVALLQEYEVKMLNLQSPSGFNDLDFDDAFHLSKQGRVRFTPIYTQELTKALQQFSTTQLTEKP